MRVAKPHTAYLISSIYVELQDVTHYTVHKHLDPGISPGNKLSKEEVVVLVECSGLPVYVLEWDYERGNFDIGKQVNCNLDYKGKKYLWINAKDPKTRDLRHLIKMNWFDGRGIW